MSCWLSPSGDNDIVIEEFRFKAFLSGNLLDQLNRISHLVLVQFDVAHGCVEVLVPRKRLDHACIDALVRKLCVCRH